MKFGQTRPRSDGSGQDLTVKVHVTVHHTKGVHTRSYMVINKRFISYQGRTRTKRNPGPKIGHQARPGPDKKEKSRTKYFFSPRSYEIFENLELDQKYEKFENLGPSQPGPTVKLTVRLPIFSDIFFADFF